MSTLTAVWCVPLLALFAACSSDSGPTASAEGTGGKATGGGQNASGGSSSSTGGAPGSGGYDPVLAAQCGIDIAGEDCRGCLAASCCAMVEPCFSDTECTAQYESYQACIKRPGQIDFAKCLSDFTRYSKSDAGTKHQGMVACIISTCQLCGGVATL